MEGKSIIEVLLDENKALEKMLNHQVQAILQFYDEMIDAVKNTNDKSFKDGITFACDRLTRLSTEQED